MEYALKTDGITKIYGKHTVVDHVDMHVKKGAIYGFIGKNGAGKTTFMRMVAGLAAPAAGSIELFGSEELEKQRQRLGTLIEQPGLYGGMKQRLGIAIALFRNPDFLILDEPINGLDPEGIKEVRDLLSKLNKEKQITILISSHILGELSKIATSYGVIKEGALIEEFEAEELRHRCRRCVKFVVDDAQRALAILEEKCHITGYDVPGKEVIRVFDRLDSSWEMNRELIAGGIRLKECYLAGQDLEGYFMDLLGGMSDV